jgi:Zn-finger nucleic acid-binding protein
MQCPLCKKHTMAPADLVPGLTGKTCSECSGVWLDRAKYDAWRAKQAGDLPETNPPAQFAISDTRKAKICPQCGHLLLPYRVGHGLSFSIDYCGACGGVWCDRGEWDAIKAKNLHDNLHDIVSQHWQTAVRQSGVQESIEQTYARHLGANYAKAQEVRTWLRGQPQKALILAYLADTKPEGR